MKFKTTKSKFLEAVNTVKSATTKGAMPILANVLIKTDDSGITVVATDLDIVLSSHIDCDVAEKGETTVSAQFLMGALGVMTEGEVEFEYDESNPKATLRGNEISYKVNVLSPVDFPKSEKFDTKIEGKIMAANLGEMIRRVQYAMGGESAMRKVFNGINMRMETASDGSRKLYVIGFDGYRGSISKRKIEGEFGETEMFSVAIPSKAVSAIRQFLKGEEQIAVKFGANLAEFSGKTWSLATKLYAEEYPDVKAKLKQVPITDAFAADRIEFLTALKQVSISTGNLPSVEIELDKGIMILSASDEQLSDSRRTLAVKYDGEKAKFKINPVYIINILDNLDNDEIELCDFPVKLMPKHIRTKDESFTSFVLPLKG